MTDGASIRLYRDGFDPRDVWRVAHALAKALVRLPFAYMPAVANLLYARMMVRFQNCFM